MKQRKVSRTGFFFTLIELLVVICIITMLASILLPALSKARERSRGLACMSNQKQISIALSTYAGDFNNFIVLGVTELPGYASSYVDFICGKDSYIRESSRDIFVCPTYAPFKYDNLFKTHGTRWINAIWESWCVRLNNYIFWRYFMVGKVPNPSSYWIGADSRSCNGDIRQSAQMTPANNNSVAGVPNLIHNNRGNFFFADGHIAALNKDQVLGLEEWKNLSGTMEHFTAMFIGNMLFTE